MDFKKTGVLNIKNLNLPSDWENKDVFFPVIECIEKIPCNPCSYSCPRGAITVKGDITNIPEVDFNKCNACAICVGKCPGLAIFLVNPNYTDDKGAVTMPYEFTPLPEKNKQVKVMDREGNEIGTGIIENINIKSAFENTPLITVKMNKDLVMHARHITFAMEVK